MESSFQIHWMPKLLCGIQKWYPDASYDYCHQCGSDYYSHIDVKNNQIAPIRRGWCYSCRINLSLNQQLECEACYYQSRGKPEKAHEINQLRLKAKKEVEEDQTYKEIQRIKTVRQNMFAIKMSLSGHVICSENTKKQLIQMVTPQIIEWDNDRTIPIKLLEILWQKFNQKARKRYEELGICF